MSNSKLYNAVNYTGQEKQLRQLLLSDKKATAEEIALMTREEICELVVEDYEIIYASSEIIGLVKYENLERVKDMIVEISR